MYNACDYYKPITIRDLIKCTNCIHWLPLRECCSIEDKVLRNDKTALVHEPVPLPRSRGVAGVFR